MATNGDQWQYFLGKIPKNEDKSLKSFHGRLKVNTDQRNKQWRPMATNGNDQRQQIGVDGNQHFFFWEKTLKTKQSIENSGTDGGQKAKNTADSSI